MSTLIGCSFAIGLVFVFYISGNGIKSLLNFKNDNPLSAIGLGFFVFFAFVTTATLPFQFFNLEILSYIYINIGFFLLYLVFSLVIVRNWIGTSIFSMKSVLFFVALILFAGVTYAMQIDTGYGTESINSQSFFLEILKIKGHQKMTNIFIIHKRSIFNMVGYAIAIITNQNNGEFIKSFWYCVFIAVSTSIFVEAYSMFCRQKKQGQRWGVFAATLIINVAILTALSYLRISIYDSYIYFILLIVYSCMLVIQRTSYDFNQKNLPNIIGMVMGSYMTFSVENTYPVLFLFYAFVFVMQLRSQVGYFRDISKMSWLVLVEFSIYNIVSKLWIQTGIFLAVLVLFIFLSLRVRNRYFIETKVELYLKQRNILAILLIPSALLIISAAYALSVNKYILTQNVEYIQMLFWWVDWISDAKIKGWIIFAIAMTVLGLAVAWVFLRQRVGKNIIFTALDIFFILYLTFYNPLFTNIIQLIAPNINETAGYSLIALMFITIMVLPFEIANRITKNQKENIKLVIYRKTVRLKI
jgi:hypothetical protein